MVGAGGGGFPTHVKLPRQAEIVIVNAPSASRCCTRTRSCCAHERRAMLRGPASAHGRASARSEGVVGIKEKYEDVIGALRPQLPGGRAHVPPAARRLPGRRRVHPGLRRPRPGDPAGRASRCDVGAVVMNVETVVNVGRAPAGDGQVPHRGRGGARAASRSACPSASRSARCSPAAGGATVAERRRPRRRRDDGPARPRPRRAGHQDDRRRDRAARRPRARPPAPRRRGARSRGSAASACDQCSFCTELCPRYLLGHPIEPHRAMRASASPGRGDPMIAGTLFCCECNLCTLFACPEDLDPKNVCVAAKPVARENGRFSGRGGPADVQPHPLAERAARADRGG